MTKLNQKVLYHFMIFTIINETINKDKHAYKRRVIPCIHRC